MSTLSSPQLRCLLMHIGVCEISNCAFWILHADWNGCHGFHCSEFFRGLLHNPVASPCTFPPSLSIPPISQSVFVLVGSGVQARSDCWKSIGPWSEVSSGRGAPGKLYICTSLVNNMLMAIEVHILYSNCDHSQRSPPAGTRIAFSNSESFTEIGW